MWEPTRNSSSDTGRIQNGIALGCCPQNRISQVLRSYGRLNLKVTGWSSFQSSGRETRSNCSGPTTTSFRRATLFCSAAIDGYLLIASCRGVEDQFTRAEMRRLTQILSSLRTNCWGALPASCVTKDRSSQAGSYRFRSAQSLVLCGLPISRPVWSWEYTVLPEKQSESISRIGRESLA